MTKLDFLKEEAMVLLQRIREYEDPFTSEYDTRSALIDIGEEAGRKADELNNIIERKYNQ